MPVNSAGEKILGMPKSYVQGNRDANRGAQDDVMRPVVPHLQHAAQINLRLGAARFNEASSAEVLENLACGVIIVSGDGKALFVNRAAAEVEEC